MNRDEIKKLAASRPLVLDGATGTELFKRGLPAGASPEKWVMDNPESIQGLHREYYAAGSDIVLACTFGANRLKLADHGLQNQVREMNCRLVEISRQVVPAGKFLFGDMSPTGQLVEPFGPLLFEEAVAVYREQAHALRDAGVDGFMIETMMDIQEARAALLAVREIAPDMPAFVGMTYEKNGRSLGGTPPEAAVVSLQALGADAVGCNCSTGPEEMLFLMNRMLPYARVPVFIKPNAGMPVLENGKNHYHMEPEPFAAAVAKGIGMGAGIVGGCCGTTPAHIKAVRTMLDKGDAVPPSDRPAPRAALSSARAIVDMADTDGQQAPLTIIGERINPTGKKAFQAELLAGNLSRIITFAEEQKQAGATLLDVNLGLGGIDEPSMLRQAVGMLAPVTDLPLVIDTVDPEAMEMALRLYPGRALVNSISGETSRLEHILPIAARYGAMIIVLPVGEGFIPATADQRMEVAGTIIVEAEQRGILRDDMLVDGLAMTVSADPGAGLAALEFIRMCREAGLRSLLGLSNVSFGMPERKYLNSIFLAMGMANGLSAVIANPSAELLMEAKTAADALLSRYNGTAAYIDRFAKKDTDKNSAPPVVQAAGKTAAASHQIAAEAVLKGNASQAGEFAKKAVVDGMHAGELVSNHLVPAIMAAGDKYEKGEYYLPQLMLAGEAMRKALDAIEPELAAERAAGADSSCKGKIVMATVKGDVHDIGKNLVTLMLRNHGFDVLDLGKDVSSEQVIQAIDKEKPQVVGLSALMTTTLAAMRDTISAVRGAGKQVKFMVGGAAVTEHFAHEAGADGYAADAVAAVKLAGELAGDSN